MSALNKGIFISFEGGEGSGKTSQIKLLEQFFQEQGLTVKLTREPGGSAGAEAIRQLLLTGDADRWDGVTELFLLNAARRNHVESVIRPALENGEIVLCDRFTDSTRAYQGFGYGLDRTLIEKLNREAIGDFQPDITFLLDIDVNIGIERALGRGGNEDRYENMDRKFHERMRNGFLTLARVYPDRIVTINANDTIDEIAQLIQKIIVKRLDMSLKVAS